MKQFQVLCILLLILITTSSTQAIDYAKNGCNDTCGFVRIPYPFGIGASCSANKWYVVDCNSSTPYLSAFNNMEVLDINFEEQTVIVNVSVISSCQYSGHSSSIRHIPSIDLGESPFVFSGSHNILTVEGCGYAALLSDGEILSMCSVTSCTDSTTNEGDVCYGPGCCQTKVSHNLKSYSVDVTNLKGLGGDGACGSAYLGITPLVFDSIWRHGYLKIWNASYYPISLMWFLTKDNVLGKENCWKPKSRDDSLDLGNGMSIDHVRKCSCGMRFCILFVLSFCRKFSHYNQPTAQDR